VRLEKRKTSIPKVDMIAVIRVKSSLTRKVPAKIIVEMK